MSTALTKIELNDREVRRCRELEAGEGQKPSGVEEKHESCLGKYYVMLSQVLFYNIEIINLYFLINVIS